MSSAPSFDQMIDAMTLEVWHNMRTAVETGRWPDGRQVSDEQRQLCLQAVIAWEARNLPEEERTGYMGGQECGSKSKKAEAAIDTSLFAPASGTRH